MPNYSLVENLDWLRENKQLFIDTLDSKLDSPSGLTVHTSWDDIVAYINNLPTYILEIIAGAIEELERFLGDNIEKAIQITSDKVVPYAFSRKSSIKRFIGNNVVTVGKFAFQGCTNLESFDGAAVTTVETYAFYNSGIKAISGMPNLKTIGSYAFQNCTELANLDLTNVTSIGSYAFLHDNGTQSKLTDLVFGPNTTIGNYAFSGQDQLNSTLYLNCKSVGQYAFHSCRSLREIVVTTDVTTMGYYALNEIGSINRILCEATSRPSGWNSTWNGNNYPVYWNCIERDWVFKYNSQQEDTTFQGRIIDVLPVPEPKEGYEFDCWYTDSTLTTAVTVPFALPSGNYPILYAGWKIALHVFLYNTETETLTDFGFKSFKSLQGIQSLKADVTVDHIYLDAEYTQELTDFDQLQGHAGEPIYIVGATRTIYDFDYTGESIQGTLSPGTWLLECWGAQGGYRSDSNKGGFGGYSAGQIEITQPTNYFVYVGGSGNSGGSAGGFGGGGSRASYPGGGGASDIRIEQDSLYARVIVAGGGGSDGHVGAPGGYGGGTTGGDYGNPGRNLGQTTGYYGTQSTGGTQISGGSSGGTFGKGGYGYSGSSGFHGAGGGGWYGGGAGSADADGGGGSSYAYTAETAQYYPTGCLLTQKYYLTNVTISAGNQEFLAPNNILEVGHQDNGYVRITKIS